jgi:glycosyltransferase involved in cell wall biosynthesis
VWVFTADVSFFQFNQKDKMNKTRIPLVSIAMPVRNCERTVRRAVNSILRQSLSNWELLLLDDGSTDGTLEIARSICDPRIRLFADGQQMGLVPRLNEAVRLAEGNLLARMDGDDVAFPDRLRRQVEFLDEHPEVDLAGCGVLVFRSGGEVLGKRSVVETHEKICRRPWAGFPLGHPTWMGRIEWFRLHPYDPAAIRGSGTTAPDI